MSERETESVSGAIAPAIPILVTTVSGAIAGAAQAHATGGNVWKGVIVGGISGVAGGASAALWTVSKVASIVAAGVGLAVVSAAAYGGGNMRRTMINYL